MTQPHSLCFQTALSKYNIQQNFSDIQNLAIYIASEIKTTPLQISPGCASELSQMFIRCGVPSISNLHALILFFLQTFEEELINFDVVDNDSLIELDFLGTALPSCRHI